MSSIIETVVENEDSLIPFVIFGCGTLIAIIAIIFTTLKNIAVNGERESSRREIAAYVAEGSMSPEDGVKLLSASPDAQA